MYSVVRHVSEFVFHVKKTFVPILQSLYYRDILYLRWRGGVASSTHPIRRRGKQCFELHFHVTLVYS